MTPKGLPSFSYLFVYAQTLADCEPVLAEKTAATQPASKEVLECTKHLKSTYAAAMADDLLTPVVIASLSEPLKIMNDLLHTKKVRPFERLLVSGDCLLPGFKL